MIKLKQKTGHVNNCKRWSFLHSYSFNQFYLYEHLFVHSRKISLLTKLKTKKFLYSQKNKVEALKTSRFRKSLKIKLVFQYILANTVLKYQLYWPLYKRWRVIIIRSDPDSGNFPGSDPNQIFLRGGSGSGFFPWSDLYPVFFSRVGSVYGFLKVGSG